MSNLKEFKCPNCGSVEVVYLEDRISVSHVFGVREDGSVEVNAHWNIEDGGVNERFFCHGCNHEWPVGDVEFDYK